MDAWCSDEAAATTTYGPISKWGTGAVTDMRGLLLNAYAFDQNIGDWDVSAVTALFSMFMYAKAFNQDIGAWDVSAVKNMYLSGVF